MEIAFRDVRFSYPTGAFELGPLDLVLASGVCTAVTGLSGSGKTTLGKLCCGLLRPGGGSVLIGGKDARDMSLAEIGSRTGYLFQDPGRQIFAPTVREEICFSLTLRGVDKASADAVAQKLLELFSLSGLAERPTLRLSRGEKQRLALAAILANNPAFLVLDEPTSSLDQPNKDRLARLIETLVGRGVGVVLISHDRDFVSRTAARIIRLEGGRAV